MPPANYSTNQPYIPDFSNGQYAMFNVPFMNARMNQLDFLYGGNKAYDRQGQSRIGAENWRAYLDWQRRGGGGGGAGLGPRPTIDLDPYKQKEIAAMKELLAQQTNATRTELEGERAGAANAFERFLALRNEQLGQDRETNRNQSSARGILDSGIFIQNLTDLEQAAADEKSAEDVRVSALIDAFSRQIGGSYDFLGRGANDYGIGTLEQMRAAQEAAQMAQIERAYLNARIAQGG